MARIYVTKELGETIKTLRVQNRITGKELSAHIGKSQAFITRLENADIATISEKDLKGIFDYLSNEDKTNNETIEKIFNTLKIKYTPEEIDRQVWFENFDTVVRQVPIPAELIDYINSRISDGGIDPNYLLSRINANEALSEEEKNNEQPVNVWWANDNKPSNAKSIKMHLENDVFYGILSKAIDRTSYIYLLSIVYYLIKIEVHGTKVCLNDDENLEIMDQAVALLSKYKFYSLRSRDDALQSAKSKEERDALLTSFEKNNILFINSILSGIQYYSDKDIKTANEQLESFSKNLTWDIGFMMKLISFDFSKLENVSFTCKKDLLEKIEALINEVNDLPNEKKTFETY